MRERHINRSRGLRIGEARRVLGWGAVALVAGGALGMSAPPPEIFESLDGYPNPGWVEKSAGKFRPPFLRVLGGPRD